jgi:hypothetical protein
MCLIKSREVSQNDNKEETNIQQLVENQFPQVIIPQMNNLNDANVLIPNNADNNLSPFNNEQFNLD